MNKTVVSKIAELLKENNLDAIFIAPSEELVLVAGGTIYLCERFQGLFIKSDETAFYICNLLYKDEAFGLFGNDANIHTWFDEDGFTGVVEDVFKLYGLNGGRIGVNSTARGFNILPIAEKTGACFVNGKDILEETRIIKTHGQMDDLRKASVITDEIYRSFLDFIRPGIQEKEISELMDQILDKNGLLEAAHFALIASGPNSALPHYFGNERVIQRQDLVLMDFGCSFNGMHSDTTRTVFVGGITDKQREVYSIVLEANLTAEERAVEGAYIPDISRAARQVIEKHGYGEYYTHRLGHGIGYSGHEAPEIKLINERILKKGMSFSIEPGIYLPGEFGVRIEDVVLINEKGDTEVLNKTSKEITVI